MHEKLNKVEQAYLHDEVAIRVVQQLLLRQLQQQRLQHLLLLLPILFEDNHVCKLLWITLLQLVISFLQANHSMCYWGHHVLEIIVLSQEISTSALLMLSLYSHLFDEIESLEFILLKTHLNSSVLRSSHTFALENYRRTVTWYAIPKQKTNEKIKLFIHKNVDKWMLNTQFSS